MAIGYEASHQTRWQMTLPALMLELMHAHRYFEGVAGDKTRQGELFGLENIFMLHEKASATKYSVGLPFVPVASECALNARCARLRKPIKHN
jgi:hypothetical protein